MTGEHLFNWTRMDTLDTYRQIIKDVLNFYTRIPSSFQLEFMTRQSNSIL